MSFQRSMWVLFALLTLTAGTAFGLRFFEGDRRFVVPGPMTRGHYPIETECNRCHTPMLGVKTEACMECHAEELEHADDSHPPSKFTDPRNADRLAKLDARNCVVCHVEHRPELTRAMGLTQPMDVCKDCHADIATERASHAGMTFATCQDAGCHNFHDNRSLTEDYLARQLTAAAPRATGHVPVQTRSLARQAKLAGPQLSAADADAPSSLAPARELVDAWVATTHARAGVNCRGCHTAQDKSEIWSDAVDHGRCEHCHEHEVAGFLGGKHGMRVHAGLTPMRPSMARLPMRDDAADRELGCSSCHGAHRFERRQAAVEACLGCHADSHSLSYKASKHYAAWQRELAGEGAAGSGVACATCHLPRVPQVAGATARVQHNQNDFLRPNEKMIESVCRHCHSVEFAIDALADPALIARGVEGRPARHVRSLDLVRERSEFGSARRTMRAEDVNLTSAKESSR
jgi:Cytochrome c3